MKVTITSPFVLLTSLLSILSVVSATDLIESKSLDSCQANSSLTASLFNVVFTPNNLSVSFDVVGLTTIQGNVSLYVDVTAYGFSIVKETLNPCKTKGLNGLCPMNAGQLDIQSNVQLSQETVNRIPGIAYGVPDLQATVRVEIYQVDDLTQSAACVEANLSNGKTVYQKGVGWATAVISGLALVASAVTSGLGHSNTAAHVAANALSLFGYFQSQAIVGLLAIPLPPMVQSWTQNFDWTMGIIEVGFMQSIATWYQKSTGGTPATLLNTLTTTSVDVQKRSLRSLMRRSVGDTLDLLARAHAQLTKRRSSSSSNSDDTGSYVVKGITRVAFRANIESTNLFLTGLIFFCVFIVLIIILVALFKGFCELGARRSWIAEDKFLDFRTGWFTVLKGILFRVILIGFPQMVILCLWEFTRDDSPAEVVLAVFFFAGMTGTLAWGAMKVVQLAKRSIAMHRSPAYTLYSDPSALNKWGFLYIQFRATAYWAIIPILVYTLVKGMFVAFAQNSGTTQGIAFLIIEATALVAASVVRPWMDKSTNTFNISICVINFVNAIFLLFFTDVFNLPGLVNGVMGVVFFVANAAFSLVLLILVLISTVYAFIRKNPDSRYQPVADDRASFIKSNTQLTTELDALAVAARCDMEDGTKNNFLVEDNDSWSLESLRQQAQRIPLPASATNSQTTLNEHFAAPAARLSAPSLAPSMLQEDPRSLYQSAESRPSSNIPLLRAERTKSSTPSNLSSSYQAPDSTTSLPFRKEHNSSPWQRGAGYDHSVPSK